LSGNVLRTLLIHFEPSSLPYTKKG